MDEVMRSLLARNLRRDESGRNRFAILQAEDELAAAGMVLGAGWAGARAMTATSGPGLSLMAELVGLGYFAEIPGVFFDVQRVGPSTGLPTKTEQSDLNMALYGRHGESPVPVIAASTPGQCFDAAMEAARVAVTYRTPVILLTDAYLANGMAPTARATASGRVLRFR